MFAGILSDFVVHPIDTLRARLQAQVCLSKHPSQRRYSQVWIFPTDLSFPAASFKSNTRPDSETDSFLLQRAAVYKGAADAFVKTISNEGVKALYKGFGIVALATTPAHALYFTVYEGVKRRLQTDKPMEHKSSWVYFSSGFLADIVGLSIWLPMDLIKQRLQVQQNNVVIRYKNSAHAFYTIAREEGIRGLYRGGLIAAFSMYGAVYFPMYENYKLQVAGYRKVTVDDLTLADQLIGGFVAGGIAAAITCPSDVIKTQMQVYSIADGGERTIRGTVRQLYGQGGLAVFTAGLLPRILWIGGGTAITMGAYEQCKKVIVWFGRRLLGATIE